MTTPRDDIAGLSERLKGRAAGTGYGGGDPLCAEAATQLDSLQARVKELEKDFAKLTDMAKESEALRKNALAVAEQWQSRSLRLQQERDEAIEALEPFASVADECDEFSDVLDFSEDDRISIVQTGGCQIAELSVDDFRSAQAAIRRLAGPEKEKKDE